MRLEAVIAILAWVTFLGIGAIGISSWVAIAYVAYKAAKAHRYPTALVVTLTTIAALLSVVLWPFIDLYWLARKVTHRPTRGPYGEVQRP
jgi:hypothetical protein